MVDIVGEMALRSAVVRMLSLLLFFLSAWQKTLSG